MAAVRTEGQHMGITPGQEQGFEIQPGLQTGDLVINTPDGRRIVTENGLGYERLYFELSAMQGKFGTVRRSERKDERNR